MVVELVIAIIMGPTAYVAVGDGRSGDDGDGVMVVVAAAVMMTKTEVEKLAVVMEAVASRAIKLLRTFLYTSLGGSMTHFYWAQILEWNYWVRGQARV